jgi:hypothetical protein
MDRNEDRGRWLGPTGYAFAVLGISVVLGLVFLVLAFLWLIGHGGGFGPGSGAD